MEGTKFIVRKKYEFQQGDLYFSVDLLGTFVPLEFRSKKSIVFFSRLMISRRNGTA